MNKERNGDLSPNLREQLQALNRDFLDLLIFEHASSGASSAPNIFLPFVIAAGLRDLSSRALDDIALCRYTLFSLSFHATEAWRRLARNSGAAASVEQRYSVQDRSSIHGGREPNASFLSVALTFAWHLYHMDMRLARIVLGLRDETASVFAAISLWRLQQIAHERPDLLAVRWPDNMGFWPDLIKIARDGTPSQLESARLVGAQLIAQELEPSSIQRLSPPPAALRRK